MQIQHEITYSERDAVKRHLTSDSSRLSPEVLDKILSKYEITLQTKLNEVLELKMDLDDRDLAINLFLQKKLNADDIKNLINNK